MSELSICESNDLQYLEQKIEKNISSFREAGEALLRIKEGKLYREHHSNFEEYLRERWNMGKTHAYRLFCSSKTAKTSPAGDKIKTERQARALKGVPPEKHVAVMDEAEKSVGENPSGPAIEDAVKRVDGSGSEGQPRLASAMKIADKAIKVLKQIPEDDLDRKAALAKVRSHIDSCLAFEANASDRGVDSGNDMETSSGREVADHAAAV